MSECVKTKNNCKKKVQTKIDTICALTTINEAMTSPEIFRISGKTAYEASRAFNKEWLCHYLCPRQVIHDNRPEFSTEFLELLSSYAIWSMQITVKNPRPNLVERMH